MRYYFIAGEASGDLHGSNLIKAMRELQPSAEMRCWGGDKMQAAGATVVKHYRDLAFMGFAEVVMNLPTILGNISFCKKDILVFKPEVIVLIDYPGFNLRIAKWAKKQGFKVVYYISPQVWAWKENRVKMMKQCIDLMLVILPFEKQYFAEKWNWAVDYVGHPLVHVIDAFVPTVNSFSNKPIVAVLPGSRKQEIRAKLPVMLQAAAAFPNHQFIVAKAPGIDDEFYQPFLQPYQNVAAVGGLTYDLLSQAKAAIVTSGTATLETALFGVPEVVCYKAGKVSYQIAKRIITIKYISLVNLIMDKLVVKELIQHDMTPGKIIDELKLILNDENYRSSIASNFQQLKLKLSGEGDASKRAATLINKGDY